MILETFAFLFHTDGTEKVQKEIKDLKGTTDQVTESNSSLKKGFEEILSVIAPLTAAYVALRGIMNFTAENDQLWQMSELSGVSARAISELGFAMSAFGGNVNTAAHTIQNLQMQIMNLRRTGSGPLLHAGMMYGIGFSTDPNKMMENIARRMQSLNTMQKLDLGSMLGLDNSTILLLSKGVENLRKEMERAKKYTFIDEKAIEQSHEFRRTFSEFSAIIGGIGIDLATVIMPYANDIMTFVRDTFYDLKKHKFLLLEIAAIIGTITGGFGIFQLITNPIAQILAALAAISVIGEDIYGYFNGMDSYLGQMAAKCPELKQALDSIGEAVKNAWQYVQSGDMYKDIKAEFDRVKKWWDETPLEEKKVQIQAVLSEAWDNIVKKMNEYKTEINDIWSKFVTENKATFDILAKYLAGDFWKDVGTVFGNIENVIKELADDIAKFIDPTVKDFKELATIIQDSLVKAFDILAEKLKNITTMDFFQTIKDFLATIQAWFGNVWDSVQMAGAKIVGGYQSTQVNPEMVQTLGAMQNYAMVERANAPAREALHQLTSVNNNQRNTNFSAPVTINVQEGNRQTGEAIANGITDTFGNYATGVQ